MKCDHAQEFFSDYVTGEMDRALSVPLENHLVTCDACRETIEDLRSLWKTLDAMPVVEPSPSFHASLMEKIGAEQDRLERPLVVPARRFNWRTIFQVRSLAYASAALVLCVGIRVAQVEMSGLGGFDMIFPWLSTSVSKQTLSLDRSNVEWTPGAQSGGAVTVTLQAKPRENGSMNALHYRVRVVNVSAQSNVAVREGIVFSNRPAAISIPLNFTPTDTSHQVAVELSSTDAPGIHSKDLMLPLHVAR